MRNLVCPAAPIVAETCDKDHRRTFAVDLVDQPDAIVALD
jgi:hypothetical protein